MNSSLVVEIVLVFVAGLVTAAFYAGVLILVYRLARRWGRDH